LHVVFLAAVPIAFFAFILTLLLKEVPLRASMGPGSAGSGSAGPDASGPDSGQPERSAGRESGQPERSAGTELGEALGMSPAEDRDPDLTGSTHGRSAPH
jgi:hypothetical protein